MKSDAFSGSTSLLGFFLTIFTVLRADFANINGLLFRDGDENKMVFIHSAAGITVFTSVVAISCFVGKHQANFSNWGFFDKLTYGLFISVLLASAAYPIVMLKI